LDATLMMERDTGRPRGFGFVTFESSEGVEEALKNPNLSIKDKGVSLGYEKETLHILILHID
jgi:RNA recognition motif-containing protein